jgi:hypothetical protein
MCYDAITLTLLGVSEMAAKLDEETTRMNIVIPVRLVDWLKEQAEPRQWTFSHMAREIIEEAYKREQAKLKKANSESK